MTWAWAISLPPTLKLVLTALADSADDQGVCRPSHKTLARKCTLPDRTLRRVLTHLQSQQFLEVAPRVRKGRFARSDHDTLHLVEAEITALAIVELCPRASARAGMTENER